MSSKILALAVFAIAALPMFASAHAIPVSLTPASSEVLDVAPEQVSIRFSERIDPGASAIKVTGPNTLMRDPVQVDPADPRTLIVPLQDDGNGTYLVSWSVVSSDDGHFTKGSYAFAVGAGSVIQTDTDTAEVVTISTAPEALGITVELLGNGIIWAVLLFFALIIRPLRRSGTIRGEDDLVRSLCGRLIAFAGLFVISGGLAQLYIKSSQLASLQEIDLWHGFAIYAQTTAGSATIFRMLAVVGVLILYAAGRKRILASQRFTWIEGGLMACMAVFAYFRAIISHATANPFHPPLSIAFNFVHVIEKDLWAGLLLILLILSLQRRTRDLMAAVIPKLFVMLTVDFGLISITAAYIVWLHLKDFGNLLSTQWGSMFLQLFAAALLLVALRTYHVFARLWRLRLFSKALPFTLGAEFGAALLVVYYSSVVIITSPPLLQPHLPVFSASDQGVTLTLSRDEYEDGKLLLTTTGDMMPTLTVTDENAGTSGFSVDLSERFAGGYVFPESILAGEGPFRLAIVAPQSEGYDAHANFTLAQGTFDPPEGWEKHRPLDFFTVTMILIALAAVLFAAFLHHFASRERDISYAAWGAYAASQAAAGTLLVLFLLSAGLGAFEKSPLSNPFKAQCEGDGNMWHLMQPMKAGIPVASESMEGCMWGMGNATYLFPDMREYTHDRSLPQAEVTLEHDPFVANEPASFTISLKEPDGSPAKLFVDMEKLIHVVIVSKDESVFAHIHPDDLHPLTSEEIAQSTFGLDYVFPKSGEYLISVDYAHGLTLESKQFTVEVEGVPEQNAQIQTYPSSTASFEGYQVSLDYFQPFAGEVTTFKYTIMKDGVPVTDLQPYLSAAMHISVVKNDLSSFLHVHGEVHPPGVPYPPIIVKDGKIVHSMAMMVMPPTFGPDVEAHLIFPSAGLYTIWGEFKVGGKVIPTSFTVNVESI